MGNVRNDDSLSKGTVSYALASRGAKCERSTNAGESHLANRVGQSSENNLANLFLDLPRERGARLAMYCPLLARQTRLKANERTSTVVAVGPLNEGKNGDQYSLTYFFSANPAA